MIHDAHGYWLREAGGADPVAPAAGDLEADVAIVGGGYAGLWTAWHLLAADPSLRVVVLEADRCGHGPSGRNGGFCESYWRAMPCCAPRSATPAPARSRTPRARACTPSGASVSRRAWTRGSSRPASLAVATAPAHEGFGADAVAAAAALGAPERVQPLDADRRAARRPAPRFGAAGSCSTSPPSNRRAWRSACATA